MTIKFPDLSHYKPDEDVANWPALITKATEGTGYTDPTYASYKAAAAKAGIPFAGYHFLSHGVDVAAQARHAFGVIGHVPAMLDVETGTTGNPTLTEVVNFVKAYKALGGTMTLVYLPHWYWQGHWGSPSLQVLEDLGLSLISSAYTTYSDSGPGWYPYGGMRPAIWQYTPIPRDMNAFKGTIAELAALFAGTTGQGSAQTTGDDDMAVEVTVPAGYSNAGKTIDAGAALASIMRYQLETRNRVIDLAKVVAAQSGAAGAPAMSQDEVEAALRNVFADAATPDAS